MLVCAEHAHRLSGLHKQCLVVFQIAQRPDDRVERFPVSGRLPRTAINDQLLRMFGDLGV